MVDLFLILYARNRIIRYGFILVCSPMCLSQRQVIVEVKMALSLAQRIFRICKLTAQIIVQSWEAPCRINTQSREKMHMSTRLPEVAGGWSKVLFHILLFFLEWVHMHMLDCFPLENFMCRLIHSFFFLCNV